MRIIYITKSFPYGCGEPFLAPEIEEIRKLGHELVVIPMRPDRNSGSENASHISHAIITPLLNSRLILTAVMALIRQPLRLARVVLPLVCQGRIICRLKNVVIVPKALWIAGFAREWGADHIHAHWAGCTASIAWVASTWAQIPWSFTAHRWDIFENNAFEAKALDAAFVRFISLDGRKICAGLGIKLLEDKAKTIHLGVRMPTSGRSPIRKGTRIVGLCPAHLIQRKGQKYLLDALKMVVRQGFDVEIWLAGQGEDQPALTEQARSLGILERVKFLGHLPHQDLLQMYEDGTCDFVVLPSLHEGIPASLIEAMSYELPVIATAVGGTPELVEHVGTLVPAADSFELVNAIAELCRDLPTAKLRARQGRSRVESDFSVEAVGRQILNAMSDIQIKEKSVSEQSAGAYIP